jgi:putative ABC transport system substrate-binding protein
MLNPTTHMRQAGGIGLRAMRRQDLRGAQPDFEWRQRLRALGYVEGQTIALEVRWAEGRPERMSELVVELLRLEIDVLVVGTSQAALAAKKATQTIPIVMVAGADPVGFGLVASLSRPRGM